MWTPFPLTTQLVGWVNLLEKCEGAYVIMMIRSSPHASPAALMVATVDALKNRARAVHYIRAKIRTDGTGNKYEEKEEGETLTASSSSCTPNPP